MGIVLALSCLLLSPIVLFTYGIIRHLNSLHKESTPIRGVSRSPHSPDANATIPSGYSAK